MNTTTTTLILDPAKACPTTAVEVVFDSSRTIIIYNTLHSVPGTLDGAKSHIIIIIIIIITTTTAVYPHVLFVLYYMYITDSLL